MSKKKEDIFSTPEFTTMWEGMVIDCWADDLEGVNYPAKPKELFMVSTEESVKRLCKSFEAKYGKKLKYREDGLFYISYLETVVDEKYDNKNRWIQGTFKSQPL